MSHYYTIHCVTCYGVDREDPRWHGNERPVWWNHPQPGQLQDLVAALPAIAELAKVKAIGWSFLDVRIDSGPESQESLTDYATKHAGHDVRPVDQYGAFDTECGASIACGECHAWKTCVLETAHAGPHRHRHQTAQPPAAVMDRDLYDDIIEQLEHAAAEAASPSYDVSAMPSPEQAAYVRSIIARLQAFAGTT